MNIEQAILETLEHHKASILAAPTSNRANIIREVVRASASSYGNKPTLKDLAVVLASLKRKRSTLHDDFSGFIAPQIREQFDVMTKVRETKDAFDQKHGTDTQSIYAQSELPDENLAGRENCARYHPSPVASVNAGLSKLKKLGVNLRDFVFVDIGSGLGRNLLIASAYSFKRVVGIEISAYLNRIAVENIRRASPFFEHADAIQLLCVNALDYDLPDDNLVLYCWEPFSGEMADNFVRRLEDSLRNSPRKIYLVFLGAAFDQIKTSKEFSVCDMFETPDNTWSEDTFFLMSIFESNV
jgi:hypothetical protein